jgi:hypothetical protein
MKVIWGEREQEYLFKWDWTTQITLIRLEKLGFARNSAGRAVRIKPTGRRDAHVAGYTTRCLVCEGATGQLSALSP